MNIIITMAGNGSRFRQEGYTVPKFMIPVKGKTLFEWSMESLQDFWSQAKLSLFVCQRKDSVKEFILNKCKEMDIPNVKVVELDYITDGQATTCMEALKYCENNSIIVYNIDTYVEKGSLKYDSIYGDGFIPCFHAAGNHWSFVKVNSEGYVVEVKEKERISNNCSIGLYYFKSADMYKEMYSLHYRTEIKGQEKYIAPLYSEMISQGLRVGYSIISNEKVHVLGTPAEMREFQYS